MITLCGQRVALYTKENYGLGGLCDVAYAVDTTMINAKSFIINDSSLWFRDLCQGQNDFKYCFLQIV